MRRGVQPSIAVCIDVAGNPLGFGFYDERCVERSWLRSNPCICDPEDNFVGLIANESFRFALSETLLDQRFGQFLLVRRSIGCAPGDRKTRTIRHCHDLAALASLGFANTDALFVRR